jgi:ABC-type lipoprotein export system ATPase subunit
VSESGIGIRLESVSRHYPSEGGVVRAVDGVSLEVEPRTSLAIMGPSGCGKSTLLALIAGLETPTAGSVTVGGHEVSALGDAARTRLRRELLGLVFQADNLLPFLSAAQNVGLQLALAGAADGYGRCAEILARLGLEGEGEKLPDQLSGGQRQRVAVARALVNRPRAVLADEPTGSLDSASSGPVIDLLLGAQRELGATMVVVTHDPEVAGRLDRTVVLRDGSLVDEPEGRRTARALADA